MKITQCNQCKKKSKENAAYDKKSPWVNGYVWGKGLGISFDLCEKCGTKFAQYVKKYFGIKEEKKNV